MMRYWIRCGAGLAATALAALTFVPELGRAFTVLGIPLGLDQRDARVFNNFQDPEANDNTQADPNWPGYTGAPLAVWKSLAEWGSELHGDGSGDPTQPFDVGSGGANFDNTWQGLAPAAGGTNSNTVMTSHVGGGILAFTETPAEDGWRIILNEDVLWDDGPGVPVAAVDIQGVVVHEYGHALGLGHSNVGGSSMFPSISGSGAGARSLAADDIAGVQFLYGEMSPTKPHIEAILGTSTLTILGANFDAIANEVWFTQAVANPTGDPIVVTGVTSTAGGTRIDLALPALAGPGDVLVRVAGSSGAALSNAYPFDSTCTPVVYCTAKVNSLGCTPSIGFSGGPSASATSGFDVTASAVLNNKNGLLFYGTIGPATLPFQGGVLCVAPPIKRSNVQSSGGNPPPNDCSGTFSYDFNARIASGMDPALVPGASAWLQYWSRDPGFAPPSNTSLTDALSIRVCP